MVPIKALSRNKFSMRYWVPGKKSYVLKLLTAEVDSDGLLRWSDGDSWACRVVSESILIPDFAVGLVLGKNCHNVKRLQSQTGCSSIRLDRALADVGQEPGADDAMKRLVLVGPPESVRLGKAKIEEICKKAISVGNLHHGRKRELRDADHVQASSEAPAAEGELLRVCPEHVLFTHDRISKKFRCGTRVDNTTENIKRGKLAFSSFPPMLCVEVEGNLYSLSNRRLFVAHILAPRSDN